VNTKIKYHSVAVRCSELPSVHWAKPADEIFHRWEGTQVWLIDSNDFSIDQIRFYAQELSYKELDKASRFHFDKDRIQYILTHGILRELLEKYFQASQSAKTSHKVTPKSPYDLGIDAEILFEENEFGKPFMTTSHKVTSKSPCDLNSNIEFNISHSGNMILIGFRFCKNNVINANPQIGVDIEKIKPDFDFELVLDEFFTPKEQEAIWKSENSSETFFKFWTQKEALVKATGTGLTDDLKYYNLSAQSFGTDKKENQLRMAENAFSKFLTKEIFIHSFKIKNSHPLNRQTFAGSIALLDSDTQLKFFRYNNI